MMEQKIIFLIKKTTEIVTKWGYNLCTICFKMHPGSPHIVVKKATKPVSFGALHPDPTGALRRDPKTGPYAFCNPSPFPLFNNPVFATGPTCCPCFCCIYFVQAYGKVGTCWPVSCSDEDLYTVVFTRKLNGYHLKKTTIRNKEQGCYSFDIWFTL